MQKFVPILLLAALTTGGCTDDNSLEYVLTDNTAGNGGQQQPATGTVRLSLGNPQPEEGTLSLNPAVREVEVQFFATDTGAEVSAPRTFPVDPSLPVQEFVLEGVQTGSYRVLVSGFDEEGLPAGVYEQEVNVTAGETLVAVSGLFSPGQTREIGRVSIGTNGDQAVSSSTNPSISADSRYVAFVSTASLASNDGNSVADIYLRDRTRGTTTRLSIPIGFSNTASFSGESSQPEVSDTGKFTVFAADNAGRRDIWYRDLGGETVTLPSGATATQPASTNEVSSISSVSFTNVTADRPRISGSGNAIVYTVNVNGAPRILYFKVADGTTVIASRRPAPTKGDVLTGSDPRISSDGNLVFYRDGLSVYVRNMASGVTSVAFELPTLALNYDISGDGRTLVNANGEGFRFVTVATGAQTLVAATGTGVTPISVSRDASTVAFVTATKLVSNDANGLEDVYIYDQTQGLSRVNVSGDGWATFGTASSPDIAADEGRVAFDSADSLLVPRDTNNASDVFTANVPKPGKLITGTAGSISITKNFTSGTPSTQNIVGTSTQLGGVVSFDYDPVADRLYVLQRRKINSTDTTFTTRILVFNSISRLNPAETNLNTAPSRVLNLTGVTGTGAKDVVLDFERDLAYVAMTAGVFRVANISTGNGSVAATSLGDFFTNLPAILPESLLLDTRLNELYVSTADDDVRQGDRSPALVVLPRANLRAPSSTGPGRTAPSNVGINVLRHLAFDISPRAVANGLNAANLVGYNDNFRTDALPTDVGLVTFNGNGSEPGNPLRLPGLYRLTRDGAGDAGFVIDALAGKIYARTTTGLGIFPTDANDNGPVVSVAQPAVSTMILDRTR